MNNRRLSALRAHVIIDGIAAIFAVVILVFLFAGGTRPRWLAWVLPLAVVGVLVPTLVLWRIRRNSGS